MHNLSQPFRSVVLHVRKQVFRIDYRMSGFVSRSSLVLKWTWVQQELHDSHTNQLLLSTHYSARCAIKNFNNFHVRNNFYAQRFDGSLFSFLEFLCEKIFEFLIRILLRVLNIHQTPLRLMWKSENNWLFGEVRADIIRACQVRLFTIREGRILKYRKYSASVSSSFSTNCSFR